jgi:threonine dehydratase
MSAGLFAEPAVDLAAVRSAAARIAGTVVATPVLGSPGLDRRVGARVLLKAECLQTSGAFKLRGAVNAMAALSAAQLRRGVVAGSSGNHARAVALAAGLLGATALAVLPSDIPAAKREAVTALGAGTLFYDRRSEDREAVVGRVVHEQGRVSIPSSDSPLVMAGAGTVALEFLTAVGELDLLVVPVGGGGLAAGCGVVAHALSPGVRVVGVEPVTGDDTRRSLAAGVPVRIPPPVTLADGLCHTTPGRLTYPINRRLLDRIVLVSDADIIDAMGFLLADLDLVVEPTGACALAAVLSGRLPVPPGSRVGVVLSGGNIAASSARSLIASAHPAGR